MRIGHNLKLGVNIDHVATLRQARRDIDPDPVAAAQVARQAGADLIVCHLREDRRHIQERDVEMLRRRLTIPLNLEMAVSEDVVAVALRVRPHAACLVPEKREEVTTEGGLDVAKSRTAVAAAVEALRGAGVPVSRISRTACVIPTKSARATIAKPMFSASTSGSAATGPTFR